MQMMLYATEVSTMTETGNSLLNPNYNSPFGRSLDLLPPSVLALRTILELI